jgi:molybdenum cofactor synthesis domain-containing protein
LCHPLPVEEVKIEWKLSSENNSAMVYCTVTTTSKTGVEMEALTGASAALLCLYDVIKMVEPALVMENIRLEYKQGGKSGMWRHPECGDRQSDSACETAAPLLAVETAVITISDRVSSGVTADVSGPQARRMLETWGARVADTATVPDDRASIREKVKFFVEKNVRLIVTTGGTGLGPRDVTLEALGSIARKEIRGLGEYLRSDGATHKLSAWLGGPSGFIVDKALVVALPGSPSAVEQCLNRMQELLPHALHIIGGGGHDEESRCSNLG